MSEDTETRLRPLRPEDFEAVVEIDSRITGASREGRELFRVKVTSCVISRPAFKSTPIPEAILQRIHDYRKACGEP